MRRDQRLQNIAVWVGMVFILILGIVPLLKVAAIGAGWDSQYSIIGTSRNLLSTAMDRYSLKSIARSLVFASIASSLQFGMALLFTRFFFVRRVRRGLVLFLLLAPLAITPIASSLMWKAILDFQSGPVNLLLYWAFSVRIPWLSTLPVAFPPVFSGFSEINWGQLSVLLADAWLWTPFLVGGIVLAMSRIPSRYLEAAQLEGARRSQIFWRIACPLVLPYLSLLFFLRFVDSYRAFDLQWAFFGEQASAAHFTSRLYSASYLARDYRSAAVLAILGTLVVSPISVLLTRRISRALSSVVDEEDA